MWASPDCTSHSISTHSLTRRLTDWRAADSFWCRYFNSQPHEEADVEAEQQRTVQFIISTHSLTRRLTWYERSIFMAEFAFQLTASRGGWRYIWKYEVDVYDFNSQPHEEADTVSTIPFSVTSYFNSQPHEEADNSINALTRAVQAFQLTASRGGWPNW